MEVTNHALSAGIVLTETGLPVQQILYVGYTQYCSLKYPNLGGEIETSCALALARPQLIVAHLALHAAGIDSVAT